MIELLVDSFGLSHLQKTVCQGVNDLVKVPALRVNSGYSHMTKEWEQIVKNHK